MLLLKTKDICGAAVAHASCEATHSRVFNTFKSRLPRLTSHTFLSGPPPPPRFIHGDEAKISSHHSLYLRQFNSGSSQPTRNLPPPVAGHSLTTSTSPHNSRLTALKNGRRRPLHLPTRRPQGTSLSLLQHHPIPIPSHSVLTSIPKKRRHSSSPPPPPPPPPQRPRLALRNADGSLALPRGAPRRSGSSSSGGGAKRRMMSRGRPVRDSDFRGCWEAWKGKGRRG